MHKGLQKRSHERVPTRFGFRIRTSASRMAFSVDLGDISRSGAFIITEHVPQIDEVIDIEVLNTYGKKIFNCRGRVKNIHSRGSGYGGNLGFGVRFTEDLTFEQLEQLQNK